MATPRQMNLSELRVRESRSRESAVHTGQFGYLKQIFVK